jgi:hypothetical protein
MGRGQARRAGRSAGMAVRALVAFTAVAMVAAGCSGASDQDYTATIAKALRSGAGGIVTKPESRCLAKQMIKKLGVDRVAEIDDSGDVTHREATGLAATMVNSRCVEWAELMAAQASDVEPFEAMAEPSVRCTFGELMGTTEFKDMLVNRMADTIEGAGLTGRTKLTWDSMSSLDDGIRGSLADRMAEIMTSDRCFNYADLVMSQSPDAFADAVLQPTEARCFLGEMSKTPEFRSVIADKISTATRPNVFGDLDLGTDTDPNAAKVAPALALRQAEVMTSGRCISLTDYMVRSFARIHTDFDGVPESKQRCYFDRLSTVPEFKNAVTNEIVINVTKNGGDAEAGYNAIDDGVIRSAVRACGITAAEVGV